MCGSSGEQIAEYALEEPTPTELVRALRQALGLFDGAMACSPKKAWDDALAEVERLRGHWFRTAASKAEDRCLTLHVTFLNDHRREFPIHGGGDWSYREEPARIIVRPRGAKGFVRHEIPLGNVASVMIAPAQTDGTECGISAHNDEGSP